MVEATLLGLIEERAPGRLQTTLFNLLPLRRPTLEPWPEVIVENLILLAETLVAELPPEGLPLDSTSGSMHSWTLEMAKLE